MKNLGNWLGQITLARNRPIVLKYLNIKSLLADAYHTGKIGKVLPLVCKIIEGCKNSEVFKPNNPWLSSILSLLAELYTLPDLKIAWRCEI